MEAERLELDSCSARGRQAPQAQRNARVHGSGRRSLPHSRCAYSPVSPFNYRRRQTDVSCTPTSTVVARHISSRLVRNARLWPGEGGGAPAHAQSGGAQVGSARGRVRGRTPPVRPPARTHSAFASAFSPRFRLFLLLSYSYSIYSTVLVLLSDALLRVRVRVRLRLGGAEAERSECITVQYSTVFYSSKCAVLRRVPQCDARHGGEPEGDAEGGPHELDAAALCGRVRCFALRCVALRYVALGFAFRLALRDFAKHLHVCAAVLLFTCFCCAVLLHCKCPERCPAQCTAVFTLHLLPYYLIFNNFSELFTFVCCLLPLNLLILRLS